MLRRGILQRRQISFDIDTKVAEQILGPSYRNIYRQIYDFMLKEGWVHLQGSVYMSKKPISVYIVGYIIHKMIMQHPYMEKCFKRIHQTDIGAVHDLSRYVDYDGTPGKYAQNEAASIDEAIHQRRRGR